MIPRKQVNNVGITRIHLLLAGGQDALELVLELRVGPLENLNLLRVLALVHSPALALRLLNLVCPKEERKEGRKE